MVVKAMIFKYGVYKGKPEILARLANGTIVGAHKSGIGWQLNDFYEGKVTDQELNEVATKAEEMIKGNVKSYTIDEL